MHMMIETINPEIYSMRAWPNGWSLSAGLDDNLNPIRAIIELAASVKLFNPSAIREIKPNKIPTRSLKIQTKILEIIPKIEARFP